MYMTPMPVLSAAALPLIDWSGFFAGIALLFLIQVTMAEWLTIVRLLMITTRALEESQRRFSTGGTTDALK